jgi:hypothetical protein
MAITYVAGGTGAAGTGDVTPGMPSGAQTGDLIVLVTERNGGDTAGAPTGGAWTTIGSVFSQNTGNEWNTMCSAYYAWYDAGLNLTVPDGGDHTLARLYAFRGVDTAKPLDVTPVTGSNPDENNASHTASGLTVNTGGSMVVLALSHGDDGGGASWANATLESCTSAGGVDSTQGNDGFFNLLYGKKTTYGSAGTFSWITYSAEEAAWVLFALRPLKPTVTEVIDSTQEWVCPTGVTQVFVEAIGGGGTGGDGTDTGGGGGGGGAYAASFVTVTPSTSYTVTIGAGGTSPAAGGAGGGGGDTSFESDVIAKGGTGGSGGTSSPAGGAGGLASASTGTYKYDGGQGGSGNNSTDVGGGGGASAGRGCRGSHVVGTVQTGATGFAGGGSGGNGGANGGAGVNGSVPGGGGGGGEANSTNTTLGLGAKGRVWITYENQTTAYDELSTRILAVAGGAAGAFGGGGAGGVIDTFQTVEYTSYTVTVGAGGTNAYYQGNAGANSSFGSLITATGGGKGASLSALATTGGSGGGGSGGNATYNVGAAGTAGQGNAGGNGTTSGSVISGGGGGALDGGGAGFFTSTTAQGGNGGTGVPSKITGTSVFYGGGGGGSVTASQNQGLGGLGGGGAGAVGNQNGTAGTANTGGGGGGTDSHDLGKRGGDGGSGIVVVRYKTSDFGTCTGGTTSTDGDYTVHTFTSDGTMVFNAPSTFTPISSFFM